MRMDPMKAAALSAEQLRRRCDPARFEFRTTGELADLADAPGQARATGAILFGVDIQREGYNLFAMGPEGLGRRTMVRRILEQQALGSAGAPAWGCGVTFPAPHRPG